MKRTTLLVVLLLIGFSKDYAQKRTPTIKKEKIVIHDTLFFSGIDYFDISKKYKLSDFKPFYSYQTQSIVRANGGIIWKDRLFDVKPVIDMPVPLIRKSDN